MNILDLHKDILLNEIIINLDISDIIRLCQSNKTLQQLYQDLIHNNNYWNGLIIKSFPTYIIDENKSHFKLFKRLTQLFTLLQMFKIRTIDELLPREELQLCLKLCTMERMLANQELGRNDDNYMDHVKNMTKIPGGIFKLKNLKRLGFDNSSIDNISVKITKLSKLECINFDNNNISIIPSYINNFESLTSLSMHTNNIRNIPIEIGQLINIKFMNLNNNMIEFIPNEISKLIKLTNIDLSNNNIKSLPIDFFKLTNLYKLNLSDNHLEKISKDIKNCSLLTELLLFNNYIDVVPIKLCNLMILLMSNNSVYEITPEIISLTNLQKLDLSNNKIIKIDNDVFTLPYLSDINLSYNKISVMPDKIYLTKMLTLLNLSYNNYIYIEFVPVSKKYPDYEYVYIKNKVFDTNNTETLKLMAISKLRFEYDHDEYDSD